MHSSGVQRQAEAQLVKNGNKQQIGKKVSG
jgi:hypothetical protein